VIPIGDFNPTLRIPVVTFALLLIMSAVWIFVEGAGLDGRTLAASICNLGLVAGEITHMAPIGTSVALGKGMVCAVDADRINYLTPITSMFLHGSWMHILSNGLFLWVFGKNIEDSMGRLRFIVFYLVCGLAAAAAQVAIEPASPIPMIGASGAISGVMGAYLVLYPRAWIKMLFYFLIFFRVIPLPAWLVLLYWFGIQVITALPQLAGTQSEMSSGVAVMAHVGGFITGLLLVKLFENKRLVAARKADGSAAW